MVIPSSSASPCKKCGMGELAHLRGEAVMQNGSACKGFMPEDGITKEQGLAMFSIAADAAEKRVKKQ